MKSATKSEQEIINKFRRLFDRDNKTDAININARNSLNHEMTKCFMAFELARQGRHFLTEAKFSSNNRAGRADLVDLSTGRCLEIVESEKDESIEAKRKYYPLPVFSVPARDFKNLTE